MELPLVVGLTSDWMKSRTTRHLLPEQENKVKAEFLQFKTGFQNALQTIGMIHLPQGPSIHFHLL